MLSGYLRPQIVIVVAVALTVGSLKIVTGIDGVTGLLALFGLLIAGFVALAVLFSLR